MSVQIQLDGQTARVHLSAEHALTRQALEQAMPLLAGSLRDAGLTLTGGGVFERGGQGEHPDGAAGAGPRGQTTPARAERVEPLPATARRRGVVDLVA